MARPKKETTTKVTEIKAKEKDVLCFPIYKGEFGKIAPERKVK